MDAGFWHQKWKINEIAFHGSNANPLLVKYLDRLSVAKDGRVFLPLCGKTLDIHWLISRGYRVSGAELSPIAVEQLFLELGVEPKISGAGKTDLYSAKNVDIFVGDIFDLSRELLGDVDAIYDRAALVALPEEMRRRYARHLMEITNQAPQLLICYEYDQGLMAGPPFSVGNEEIQRLYREHYELTLLASIDTPGGLKGKVAAREKAWLLKNKAGNRNL